MIKQLNKKEFMGIQPIGPLLWRLSAPAMIGMLANALYNLVDTIFIGQGVGSMAIAGVSIVFPIQMIISAFAMMFGVGAASILSLRLGERDEEGATRAAGNAMVMAVIMGVLITIVGLLFLNPSLEFFGASSGIINYSRDYISIVYLGAIFTSFSIVCNNLIRAEGNAKQSMKIMLVGTMANIIMDPIFIFVFHMGVKGAALATAIAPALSSIVALRYFITGKSILTFNRSAFVLKFKMVKNTMLLGTSSFIRQIGGSIVAILVNNLLGKYSGDNAIAAYGMINKLIIFFLMPMFGIVQGFQPIAGFNYGAQNYKRVREVMKITAIVCSLYGLTISLVNITFARTLLSIFGSDEEVLKLAIPALRMLMSTMVLIGIQVTGSTYFQAIGASAQAIFFGLSRQFIVLIPALLLLPQIIGLNGVWLSFPLSDLLATVLTAIGTILALKKLPKEDKLVPVLST